MVVIACGAIAREVIALKTLNNWDFELTCIPAQLHNTPEKIPQAVEQKILTAKAQGKEVFVGFADCGTGGQLDKVLDKYSVERLPGAHCYEFFAGSDVFAELHDQEPGTFYLTDFLARHFDALVIRGLGLERHPQLLEMYFGNYQRLVYLAQSHDDDLLERARKAAERLGLEFIYRYTGFGTLETSLTVWAGNHAA